VRGTSGAIGQQQCSTGTEVHFLLAQQVRVERRKVVRDGQALRGGELDKALAQIDTAEIGIERTIA